MMDVVAGWQVELIGRRLIGLRTTRPNARVPATPLSDWCSTIYDRSARASADNLTDHANLQQPSNEERAQLIRAAATRRKYLQKKRNNTRKQYFT